MMKTKALFLCGVLLLGAAAYADREIGFPQGQPTETMGFELGMEFPGARGRIFPERLPDGTMAVCVNGNFEFGGAYVNFSCGIPTGNYEAIEMEVARGDYEKIGVDWVDETGQNFVVNYDLTKYPRHQLVKLRLTRTSGKLHVTFHGAKDGVWHGRLKRIKIMTGIEQARQGIKTPRIYFRSIKLIGQDQQPAAK